MNRNGNGTNRVYCDLLHKLLMCGERIKTRNSYVRKLHTYTYIFDVTPLVTIRKTAWKSALREMEWFLSGSNNINDLPESVQKWWSPWADKNGHVKYNYSKQFRYADGVHINNEANWVDPTALFINGVKYHPFSRRNIITTWHAFDMAQPDNPITNCHGTIIQAHGRQNGTIDISMYQRSVDMVCGLPHNWIQYWAFLLWVCKVAGKKPGSFYWIGGDIHLYESHLDIARKLIDIREEAPIAIKDIPDLLYHPEPNAQGKFDGVPFRADDFSLSYKPVFHCKDVAEMIV